MRAQEDFPQTVADTVRKLADEIRPRAVVVHLVGEKPGAIADAAAVREYLKYEPNFLANHPELQAALGNFSGISYTQWEALIALHHDIPLLVYATDKASAQQTYLDRLVLGRRYATKIKNDTDLLGQLIGDVHEILPVVPKFTRKIVGTQLEKHAPRVLFGREKELETLDAAWEKETLNVYTLVAWGGAGKTSLVFHWVQTRFAAKGWPGVECYFDWSFYSQGTGESRQTSADLFIARALEFFGDPDPTRGGPHERGERLAGRVRQHRSLLILDGIEPLQYPPNDPQAGRLKDPALETLLRELAADNPGLVIITTREHLTNVEGHANTEEQKLDKLPKEAAVALLRHLQIVGTDEELHAAWRDAGGHALTLSLLGRFIADAYEDRDIRHYREVKFEAADQEHQGRSAFRVMIAYERWLQSGGSERQRELAALRLTGLFDRPMAKSCLQALRAEPSIPGLTDALVTLTPQQWNIAVKRLSEVELLSVSPDAIDAHPLIREYFAAQLKREQPEAFRAAHSRLFDYLCEHTPHRPDGIDGLSDRTTAADALHQSGQRAEAGILFAEAERMQLGRQSQFDLLYSQGGFRYCDWLLAPAEQAAWQHLLDPQISNSKSQISNLESEISDALAEVERRATTTLRWGDQFGGSLLDIALDHLTLSRVGLIRVILANPLPQPTLNLPHVAAAVNSLRAAGQNQFIPLGLLIASLYNFVRGAHDLARKHLAEAHQIAERGPMPLFLADIHLHRARMFRDRDELSKAAKLIRTLGYGRRYDELADAEAALGKE